MNCTEKIEKVGENHVIIKKFLYDEKGNEEELVSLREEYGKIRIDKELEDVNREKSSWERLKADITLIDSKIAVEDVKLVRLNKIKAEMLRDIEGEIK